MKITLLIDCENEVYAYAKCVEISQSVESKENEELKQVGVQYMPSLRLDDEARALGCKMVIVDESQLPSCDIGDCYFDFDEKDLNKKLKYSTKKVEWRDLENLRAERKALFEKTDKYQLPYVNATLTEEQVKEYEEWRQAWLDVTKTKEKPTKPIWL